MFETRPETSDGIRTSDSGKSLQVVGDVREGSETECPIREGGG